MRSLGKSQTNFISILVCFLCSCVQLVSHPTLDVAERTTNVGVTLIVDGKFEYADLDELIVSHIHAMARRVEDLMNHEKFKKDDDELRECSMLTFRN